MNAVFNVAIQRYYCVPYTFPLTPSGLWLDVRDRLLPRLGRRRAVELQNPDGHGRAAGHLEPDPGPLGVHPAAARRPPQDLPHRQVPGGPREQRAEPLGAHVLPQLGETRSQSHVHCRRTLSLRAFYWH